MRYVQTALKLEKGVHGEWSQGAETRLQAWLQKPAQARKQRAPVASSSSDAPPVASSSSDDSSSSSSEDEVHSDR